MASVEEATFCASVEVSVNGKPTKTVVNNALKKMGTKNSWVDFCECLLDDVELSDEENYELDEKRVKVCLSTDRNFTNAVYPEYEDSIKTAIDFNKNLKYLKFCINIESVEKSSKITPQTSAFDVLMSKGKAQQQTITKQARKKDTNAPRFTGLDKPFRSQAISWQLILKCGKPRCIYSQKSLSMRDARYLNRLLERHDYSCGSMITPEGDALESVVAVRLQMDCATHVEFPYYASGIGQPDICAHCAHPGSTKDNELVKKFKIVLPVCNTCKNNGKPIPKRNPLK